MSAELVLALGEIHKRSFLFRNLECARLRLLCATMRSGGLTEHIACGDAVRSATNVMLDGEGHVRIVDLQVRRHSCRRPLGPIRSPRWTRSMPSG